MTERRTYPKSTCCIPGCLRWSRRFPREWLCGDHWRMVPRRLRRALSRSWALLREIWNANPEPGPWPADVSRLYDRTWRREQRLWAHAKRRAILRAAGL